MGRSRSGSTSTLMASLAGEKEISVAELEADRLINAERLREGLAAVLPRLGAVGR